MIPSRLEQKNGLEQWFHKKEEDTERKLSSWSAFPTFIQAQAQAQTPPDGDVKA